MRITNADAAIDALGGTAKVARMFGLSYRVVSNWRTRGLPPDTYYVLAPALTSRGHEFSPLLFAQKLHVAMLPPARSKRRQDPVHAK